MAVEPKAIKSPAECSEFRPQDCEKTNSSKAFVLFQEQDGKNVYYYKGYMFFQHGGVPHISPRPRGQVVELDFLDESRLVPRSDQDARISSKSSKEKHEALVELLSRGFEK